jgi:hypothetical protein
MSQITVDAVLLARLNGLNEEITFCDERGRVLGRFVPADKHEDIPLEGLFVPPPEDKCPYSPEELHQMFTETGGRPLKEIWKSLGAK